MLSMQPFARVGSADSSSAVPPPEAALAAADTTLIKEAALRTRLRAYFTTNPIDAALSLLPFDFGWSDTLSSANSTPLDDDNHSALASLFPNDPSPSILARSCAAPINKPIIREEAFKAAFAWLQHAGATAASYAEAHAEELRQLLLAALTDTWSAVRRASARALGRALVPFAASELRALHAAMLALRNQLSSSNSSNAWKAHEGLLLGTTALLHFLSGRIGALMPPPSSNGGGGSSSSEYVSSSAERHSLLAAACADVRPTLYLYLAHEQLTVREYAQEAYLATLPTTNTTAASSSSSPPPACIAFAELIHRLDTATSATATTAASPPPTATSSSPESDLRASLPTHLRESLQIKSPEKDDTDSTPSLLPDYESEGLIGLLVALIPLLPPSFLLRNWSLHWPVLDRYLAHTASTVRQRSSSFFGQLLEHTPHTLKPTLARLALQSLASGWHVEVSHLCRLNPATPIATPTAATAPATDTIEDETTLPQQPRWEWRERRLLS